MMEEIEKIKFLRNANKHGVFRFIKLVDKITSTKTILPIFEFIQVE